MQPPIRETGWGKPHKDAIIVGERKTAAPHGSCEAGRVPRGPVARGRECRVAGFHGGASQGGRRGDAAAGRSRSNTCWISPTIDAHGFRGLGSELLTASASSVSSPLGEDHDSEHIVLCLVWWVAAI